MDELRSIIEIIKENRFDEYTFVSKNEVCKKMGWDDFSITNDGDHFYLDPEYIIYNGFGKFVIDIESDRYTTFKVDRDGDVRLIRASLESLSLLDNNFIGAEDVKLVFTILDKFSKEEVKTLDEGSSYWMELDGFLIKKSDQFE